MLPANSHLQILSHLLVNQQSLCAEYNYGEQEIQPLNFVLTVSIPLFQKQILKIIQEKVIGFVSILKFLVGV
jgi:hypothetical protein